MKEAGADCIKILLYYTPFEKAPINDLKQAWIERIGDECLAHDIPFFLEFVGYDVSGVGEKSVEYAKLKAVGGYPAAWRSSVRTATTSMC